MVYFEKPQPRDGKSLSSFPKKFRNSWTNELNTYFSDGLHHTVADQIAPQYIATFISKFTINKQNIVINASKKVSS